LPGEGPENTRLRLLGVLQIWSWRWQQHRLERLSAEELDTAERQIVEDATRVTTDWRACIALLYRAGHPLLMIAEIMRTPIETLHGWYPYDHQAPPPEPPPTDSIPAPPSAARN
jgi:hypothetical protein